MIADPDRSLIAVIRQIARMSDSPRIEGPARSCTCLAQTWFMQVCSSSSPRRRYFATPTVVVITGCVSLLIGAAGCDSPYAIDGKTRSSLNRASNSARSSAKRQPQCTTGSGNNSMDICGDCCFAKHPDANAAASALGICNAACGHKGTRACFDNCASEYATACRSTNGACDSYNICTDSCFLGYTPETKAKGASK